MEKVFKVGDAVYQSLVALWRQQLEAGQKNPVDLMVKEICRHFGIQEIRRGQERLVLFGRAGFQELDERLVGVLFPIAPGIVVLHSIDYVNHYSDFSGLLCRVGEDSPSFRLKAFFPQTFVSLIIIANHDRSRHPYPAYCSLDLDRDVGMRLWIESERWEKTMLPFLNRWLPEAE